MEKIKEKTEYTCNDCCSFHCHKTEIAGCCWEKEIVVRRNKSACEDKFIEKWWDRDNDNL